MLTWSCCPESRATAPPIALHTIGTPREARPVSLVRQATHTSRILVRSIGTSGRPGKAAQSRDNRINPAHRPRAARHDDPGPPHLPRAQAGRVERHHHGGAGWPQRARHPNQHWADGDRREGRTAPPAPHAPHALWQTDLHGLAHRRGCESWRPHAPPYCVTPPPIAPHVCPHLTRACPSVFFTYGSTHDQASYGRTRRPAGRARYGCETRGLHLGVHTPPIAHKLGRASVTLTCPKGTTEPFLHAHESGTYCGPMLYPLRAPCGPLPQRAEVVGNGQMLYGDDTVP